MKNEELVALNALSQKALETGIAQIAAISGGGLAMGDVVAMLTNPDRAAAKYGDAIAELLDGINGMRAVNNELVKRVTAGG